MHYLICGRILQAISEQNHKSIQSIKSDFDEIEKYINTPDIYDDERFCLEENILKQKVQIKLPSLGLFTIQSYFKQFVSKSQVPFWIYKIWNLFL